MWLLGSQEWGRYLLGTPIAAAALQHMHVPFLQLLIDWWPFQWLRVRVRVHFELQLYTLRLAVLVCQGARTHIAPSEAKRGAAGDFCGH